MKNVDESHMSVCNNAGICRRVGGLWGVIHPKDKGDQKDCLRNGTWAQTTKRRECVQGIFREQAKGHF